MLVLAESGSNIELVDFHRVEELAGGELPALFKEIYIKNNGGYPEATVVECDECLFSLNGFNPIKFGRLPIERLMQGYQAQDINLKGYVPFAYDDGGNSFMLSLNKEDVGTVYLLLQDGMEMERVCASFESFVSSLCVK